MAHENTSQEMVIRLERRSFPAPLAGVDEAGRGCLAGPVVAGAVILPREFDLPGLTDSKKLSAARRLKLAAAIREQALAWSLGVAWLAEIEEKNILHAALAAMARAVTRLKIAPGFVLVDGNQPMPHDVPQESVVNGDSLVPEISAASILAKTWRDHLLTILDRKYPGYGLAAHKGYGTKAHRQALAKLGPSPIHRKGFRGVGSGDQLCLPGI